MLLAATDYVRPDSLQEACELLASNANARPLAGGQSLLNVLKHRAASVDLLVDISRLGELRELVAQPGGEATIGAGVTYAELEHSDALRASHPVVSEVASVTVDRQVRNRGTFGGNICFADPASNFPPLVVALGATMNITGPGGERTLPADEFFSGAHRTALEPGELLRSVTLPALGGAGTGYRSLPIARESWAIARAAAVVRSNGTIEDIRVVLGCVAGTPVRATAMEDKLRGEQPSAEAINAAATAAGEGLEPPSDTHATGDYRRDMACVMAKRAVLAATGGLDG
jgi:aerobic carbon-monoxide dehydrogenase medium subunit